MVRPAHLHHNFFEVAPIPRSKLTNYTDFSMLDDVWGFRDIFPNFGIEPALEKFLYDNKCVI